MLTNVINIDMIAGMRHRPVTPLTGLWHCGILVTVPNPLTGFNFISFGEYYDF